MTTVLDLSQTSPPVSDSADQDDAKIAIALFGPTAFGTSSGAYRWRPTQPLASVVATASSTSTATAIFWFLDATVSSDLPRPEPIWAAAARALAEGLLSPPPRMPMVRPESDFEMNPAEAAAFAEPEYQSRRRGYR